ncbi:hypothetical protein GCM10027160_02690 [Streptomyces calidiresistens]|uniref:Methyltransferase domain-containing protein n=1 Tax=Streptomyces calidiresistens TaxID=1485586 RepID=A0A7W3XZD5_9ACTN|nr:class I SAM-dependent methyltransferase [Streptomyces calidiresistens]MBB0232837.1 methyltransferase domain-containing protein [Streptomyces calidiresistens]
MVEIDENRLVTYLLNNRAFFAPVVERAVALLDPGRRGNLVDIGTGAGGGLVALARAAGPGARVLGVDREPMVLEMALRHAEEEGVRARVSTRAADLLEVLDEAADAGGTFDAIWAGDVIWPGNVSDPAATVARMAEALRPGGVIGLFNTNYYQSMFLPGHSRLERLLRTASELNWGLPDEGPDHYERYPHWALAAGLEEVRVHVLPRVGFPVGDDPTVRPYLEGVVWPELLAAAEARGTDAGMSGKDLARARELLAPGSPTRILDEPGYHVIQPTLLVTARRPGSAGGSEG